MSAVGRFLILLAQPAAYNERALARASRAVLYLPLRSPPRLRHGLPEPRSFGAMLEVLAEEPPQHAGWIYRVGCRRLLAADEPPSVFLVSPVHRRPPLLRAEFDVHWNERHGPLALKHHAGMTEYRQHPVVESHTEGAPSFDGIGVLGFPSVEAFEQRLFDSPEGRRAIAADTARFIDLDRLEVAVLRDTVLRDG